MSLEIVICYRYLLSQETDFQEVTLSLHFKICLKKESIFCMLTLHPFDPNKGKGPSGPTVNSLGKVTVLKPVRARTQTPLWEWHKLPTAQTNHKERQLDPSCQSPPCWGSVLELLSSGCNCHVALRQSRALGI